MDKASRGLKHVIEFENEITNYEKLSSSSYYINNIMKNLG